MGWVVRSDAVWRSCDAVLRWVVTASHWLKRIQRAIVQFLEGLLMLEIELIVLKADMSVGYDTTRIELNEAIEVIRTFRERCSKQAQESLDNVLIDLYKQKRRMNIIKVKHHGKPTKTASFPMEGNSSYSQQRDVKNTGNNNKALQCMSNICSKGNLGWAYLQLKNFAAAEAVYRKAQEIDPDANKACNLCICLVKQGRYAEANTVLEDVIEGRLAGSNDPKLINRTKELLQELEPWLLLQVHPTPNHGLIDLEDAFIEGLDQLINQWTPLRSRRLPVFEEISTFRDQLAC
ncbi:protein sulfur deficiency-induced 2 [Tanacetum coccineum]